MHMVMKLILSRTAFITTLLYNVSTDLWVGLTSDSKGHFQWAKTGLLSYTNWAPGEPLDNSGPHHNKTPVLTLPSFQHTYHGVVQWTFFVLMISLLPSRVTVWLLFMEIHRRILACGLHELVRWKIMASFVRGNKVWFSMTITSTSTLNVWVCSKWSFFVVGLDQSLPPAPALIPASLSKPFELGGATYRVVEKRLDWTGALHLCESLNGTLATVEDPYQQAYLTLLMNSLRRPAWIALYNYGVSLSTHSLWDRNSCDTQVLQSFPLFLWETEIDP